MISQAQIHHAKEFTYPVALRSLMRQDPQVIMVGEIRDAETANIAVQAGLTGHLVISTIHSSSTAGVFARMINMRIEPFLLASSVIGVLGLRLIRTNCASCAMPYQPEPGYMKLIPSDRVEDASLRQGGGCEHCVMTGFGGRISVTEMLKWMRRFERQSWKRCPPASCRRLRSSAECAPCGKPGWIESSVVKRPWRKSSGPFQMTMDDRV